MLISAMRTTAMGHPSYSECWPAELESARRARQLIRAAIAVWGLDGLADAAETIVTELTSNAIRHAPRRYFRVEITRLSATTVRISVSDRSRKVPQVTIPDFEAETGRGLLLVEALSTVWGCDEKGWGKVVWAQLDVPEAPLRSQDCEDSVRCD